MNRNPPKVSVITVTLNRAPYLKRTLDRLFEDPFRDREVIVADGGSSDGTLDVIRSYGDRIARWTSGPDLGEYDAWNQATRLATGEIIKWLPDDDLLRPGAIQAAVDYFDAHPDTDVVFGQTAFWDDRGLERTLRDERLMMDPARLSMHHWLRHTQGVTSVSAFLRRRAVERIGAFAIEYVCGDLDFWARAVRIGVPMGLMPQVVIDYNVTGQNTWTRRSRKLAWDVVRITARYGTPLDVAVALRERKYALLGIEPFVRRAEAAADALGIHPIRALKGLVSRATGR
jgi:glycosyltransferase involved in cell wall biosynthesis